MKWGLIGALIAITLIYTSLPGEVMPLEPSSFAILKGIGNFQSDQIVIPIEWMNYGGQQALVRPTQLTLANNKSKLIFLLAGEFIDQSSTGEPAKTGKYYDIKQAFVLAPHAITPTMMVFHVKDWWSDKNRTFSLKDYTLESDYSVSLDYSYISSFDIFGKYIEQSASRGNIPLFRLKARKWTQSLTYTDSLSDAYSTELNAQNRSLWQSFNNSYNAMSSSFKMFLNKSLKKPINKSLNESLNKSLNESLNKSLNESLNKSLNESLNKSLNESLNKSLNESLNTTPFPSPNDVITQLERLAKLRDQGVLSEKEFQQQKAKVMNS